MVPQIPGRAGQGRAAGAAPSLSLLMLFFPVIRDGPAVQLDVDSEVSHVVASVSEPAQNSSAPVFIGGAPGQSPLMFRDTHKIYISLGIGVDIG